LFKTLHEEDQLQINEILILDISPFIVNDFSKGSILRCIKDGLRPIYYFEIFECEKKSRSSGRMNCINFNPSIKSLKQLPKNSLINVSMKNKDAQFIKWESFSTLNMQDCYFYSMEKRWSWSTGRNKWNKEIVAFVEFIDLCLTHNIIDFKSEKVVEDDKEIFNALIKLCSSTSLRSLELYFQHAVEANEFLDEIKKNKSLKTVTLNVNEKRLSLFNTAMDLENSKMNLKIIIKSKGEIIYPKGKCPFDIIFPE